MRASDFILREYSREKTATAFGDKLLLALQNDKSYAIGGTQIGKAREYLQQKANANITINPTDRATIINIVLQTLEDADPTNHKEYVQWLAKVYTTATIKIEDLISRGHRALNVYHTYKQKKVLPLAFRDIGRINFNELEAVVEDPDLKKALVDKQLTNKGDAEEIYNNDEVRIIHPKDQEAACYYGQGTRWCTASTDSTNYFNHYNRNGSIYILLPKHPRYTGEKYQIHFSSGQFADETDEMVNGVDLLTKRFGNLVEFFREREPMIKEWVQFASDKELQPIIDKFKEVAETNATQTIDYQEMNDDEWHTYLRKQGYAFPSGHELEGQLDYEKIANADISYTDWNNEAGDFFNVVRYAVDITPSEVRSLADEYAANTTGYMPNLKDLREIFVNNITREVRRSRLSHYLNPQFLESLLTVER